MHKNELSLQLQASQAYEMVCCQNGADRYWELCKKYP